MSRSPKTPYIKPIWILTHEEAIAKGFIPSTHIAFIRCERPASARPRLTDVWNVKAGDTLLGSVRWFGRWRKYCFFPAPDTVYEETCMRDIADVCEGLTKHHREAKRKAGAK